MTTHHALSTRIQDLRLRFADVYGIKERTLAKCLGRARTLLPRALRHSGAELVAAEAMIGHPKLVPMIDVARMSALHAQFTEHLDAVDTRALRRKRVAGALGQAAFYVLFSTAAFITWLVWSGHV